MNKKLLLFVISLVGIGDTVVASFVCEKPGVFEDYDSFDCTTFIYCDSDLKATTQTCPDFTYFWPSSNGCFSYYNCTKGSSPDGTNPCDGLRYHTIPDKYSTDCSTYIKCVPQTIYNPQYSHSVSVNYGILYACPTGYAYEPLRSSCSRKYECPNFKCLQTGYFRNPSSKNCSTFIMCETSPDWYGSGSFLYPTIVTCPPNSLFSPFSNKCDSYYTCGGKDVWNKNYPCLNYSSPNAVVANPRDKNCASYLSCIDAYSSGNYRPINVILKTACPPKTFFAPHIAKCYANYQCNQMNLTCSKDPCGSGVGSIVDYKSGHCQGYIECRDVSSIENTYQPVYQQVYCPPGLLFSPEIGCCDGAYNCPKFPVDYCYPIASTTTTTRAGSATTTAATTAAGGGAPDDTWSDGFIVTPIGWVPSTTTTPAPMQGK